MDKHCAITEHSDAFVNRLNEMGAYTYSSVCKLKKVFPDSTEFYRAGSKSTINMHQDNPCPVSWRDKLSFCHC